MSDSLNRFLTETPADFWSHGSEDNAKCNDCGLYAHDLHWINCGKCGIHVCIWCAQEHRLHGGEFHWSMTGEPVDFALLATCQHAGCGHFLIAHNQMTGECSSCKARIDNPSDPSNDALICKKYVPYEAGSIETASDPAKFWRAFEISCAKAYEAYIKPTLKKGQPVKKEIIPFCDRAILLRVCKQEYNWGPHLVDKMVQFALQADALVKSPARDMTESKFIGKYIPVFIKQRKAAA